MTRTLAPQDVDPSGAPQPPSQQSKPPKPSYTQLSGEAARAEVVFRVHSMMSASPLHWTGRAETSGFCSPNPHLGLLTPGAYAAALEPLPTPSPPTPTPTQSGPAPPSPPPVLVALDDDMNGLPSTQPSDPKSVAAPPGQNVEVYGVPWLGFERDPSIRQSLVDHCTRRTRPSHNWDWSGPDMAADDYSSWVSCTASLRWAVWEVAQRLVHGEQQVDIAVIGVVPEKDEEELRGKRPAFQRVKAGATGEVTLAPLNTLRDHQKYGRGTGDRARMTNSEKEAVANAIYMAHTSEEVLFYGRIFTGSVKANLTFTREHLPLTLPRDFFATTSSTWLEGLAWDPRHDSYELACRKIKLNSNPHSAAAFAPTTATTSTITTADIGASAAATTSSTGTTSSVGTVPAGGTVASPSITAHSASRAGGRGTVSEPAWGSSQLSVSTSASQRAPGLLPGNAAKKGDKGGWGVGKGGGDKGGKGGGDKGGWAAPPPIHQSSRPAPQQPNYDGWGSPPSAQPQTSSLPPKPGYLPAKPDSWPSLTSTSASGTSAAGATGTVTGSAAGWGDRGTGTTYASVTSGSGSGAKNHYTVTTGSGAGSGGRTPYFLSGTNAVPLGRRGRSSGRAGQW